MTSKCILAHHGSPGSNRDFLHLKVLLPEFHFDFFDRVENNYANSTAPHIQLGYSFGCVSAIIAGALNTQTEKIILISPYIYPEKKIGLVLKNIMNTKLLRNPLLKLMADKKIEQMLITSSSPKDVPANYQMDAKDYLKSERMAHAILEKDFDTEKLFQALNTLEKRKIPIHIIYGEKDLTSAYEKQIMPLLEFSNVDKVSLSDAGHALLWTHTEQLAELIKSLLSIRIGYFNGADTGNNVAAFLKKHMQNFPQKNILTWVPIEELKNWNGDVNSPLPTKSVTVAELDYLVGILTHEFKNCGIKFGDRVILFLPMSLPMYASMFALQKMGAIPTFLDSWARRDQMGASAKVATPTAMISAHRAFVYLNEVEEIKNIPIKIVAGDIPENAKYNARLEFLMTQKTYEQEVAVEKEHSALITFTTGSSGTPKGADRGHRFLAAQHYALNRNLPYTEADRDLPVFPIFSLNNLAAGVETIIPAIDVGNPAETDAMILYAQLKSAGVTCTTLSPSLFNHLASYCIEKNLKLDFLKRVVTGGAPVSYDDVKRMKSVATKAKILVLYGSTEVEPMAEIEATEMLNQIMPTDPELVEDGVNVGHIDSGLKFRFIQINKEEIRIHTASDWANLVSKDKTPGELIVAGEHVCERYFNNEEAFFKAKIKDENGIIWHRTGDLGFLDKNNNLWIVGRVHNAIKRNDIWYFPVKAEIILKKFSFIHRAAFLGIPDQKLGEKVVAVFTTNENCLDIENYKKEIKRVLEKNNFVIDDVIHTEEIPMDPRHHSKVEYGVLRNKIMGIK
jgi:acyl-CoA synthetase (AMP-forming)/AMP-acid ligase II/pimeloyl-ACP methyl ester carboxylesterase